MHPSDTTPTPSSDCTDEPASKVYHLDNSCQGSPPGAPEGPPEGRETSRKAAHDLTQFYFRYLSRPTEDHRTELRLECEKFLERKIRYYVFRCGFCPLSSERGEFAEQVLARTTDLVWGKAIPVLNTPTGLASWLQTTALNAIRDQFRKINGRSKDGPYRREPLESSYPDGTIRRLLDEPENQGAAARHGWTSVQRINSDKQLFFREVLGKLFRAVEDGSERHRIGLKWLQCMADEGFTVEDLAMQSGMTSAEVRSILCSTRKRLRKILEARFKFTATDLL